MSNEKQCEGCGKNVPESVITCDDCTFAKIAAPGVTKAEWIASLASKPVKKEKPKFKKRKPFVKPSPAE